MKKGWIVALSIFFCGVVQASSHFEEGKQYIRLHDELAKNPVIIALKNEKEIQVFEFFSYNCIWCYRLENAIAEWAKNLPDKVNFQRIPVEFQPTWGLLSKAYFTEVGLNAVDKIHIDLFRAVQSGEIGALSEEAIEKFFFKEGIEKDDFLKTWRSPEVAQQHKRANDICHAYQIQGIPAIIIQGKNGAYLTSVPLTGSQEDLINVMDYLIKKELGLP